MSEQGAPALPQDLRPPPPDRPAPLPQRPEAPSRVRATMPPATRGGYEEILAVRIALRTRAEHASARGSRGAIAPGEVRAPAAAPSPEAPPRLKPNRRRPMPAVVVSSALAAPACAMLAFTWIASPRLAVPYRMASPGASGVAVTATHSVGEKELVFAAGDRRAISLADDAETEAPDERAPARSPPIGGEGPPFAEEEDAIAAQGADDAPQRGAEAGFEPPREGAPSHPAPNGWAGGPGVPFAQEKPAFAAWEQDSPSWATVAEPAASPGGTYSEPAPGAVGSEPGRAAADRREPASVALDRDAPVLAAGAGSGTPDESGSAPTTATAEAESAAPPGDAPQALSVVRAMPESLPPPFVPPATNAGLSVAAPAHEDELHVPAFAGAPGWRPAPVAGPRPASIVEGSSSAGRVAPTAAPDPITRAAAETAAEAPVAGKTGGAAEPPEGRVAAALAAPPAPLPPGLSAPPAKFRPGGPVPPPQPVAKPAAARDGPFASQPQDSRCRAIIMKAQLGEETSHAERLLLRSGCGARR